MATSESPVAPAAPEVAPQQNTQTPTEQVQAAPPTTETSPQPKQGNAFAVLAKKEKANREAAEKLKQEKLAFGKERTEYQAFQEAKANAKRFPLKFLESMGLTYQDLVEAQLNDGQPTPNLEVKAVRDELETFKKQQEEERQRIIEEQKRYATVELDRAMKQFQKDCETFIASNQDKYELTVINGASHLIADVVTNHWEQQLAQGIESPQLLGIEEAAEVVEKHFEEQAAKLAKAKKFTAKVQPQSPEAAQKRSPDQQPRSVTNSMASSTQAALPPAKSRREREERARAVLESLNT